MGDRKRLYPDGVSSDTDPLESAPAVKKAKGGFRLRSLSADHGFDGRTNDEIHSDIKYCRVIQVIMDTKQMQRLRFLKQLGTAEYAYVNVNHNRFEHSLGVAHLAERMCRRLKAKQSNLSITEKDVLCVKLAGLLHDIGHGPFSHVYDGPFRDKIRKRLESDPNERAKYERFPPVSEDWTHEEASLMMIDALLEDLGLAIDMDNLDAPLKQIGDGIDAESMRVFDPAEDWQSGPDEERKKPSMDKILTSRDWVFIKECIIGRPIREKQLLKEDESGFVGRLDRDKEFLYDIVANRHSGLDVDKIDYYARDMRRATRASGEIELRMIEEAIVAKAKCSRPDKCFRCNCDNPGMHLMICYPDKMVEAAIEFFKIRFKLHSKIYGHKTSVAATFMICDILMQADPFFHISTSLDGEGDSDDSQVKHDGTAPFLPISRAMLHKTSYLRLRDGVIDQIMHTTTPQLRPARKLIERLWNRDLYKCAGVMKIDIKDKRDKKIWKKSEEEIVSELLRVNGMHDGVDGQVVTLHEDDIIVEKRKSHHGMGLHNPLSLMRFLPKSELSRLTRPVDDLPEAVEVDPNKYKSHIPIEMQEHVLRFFCRGSAEKVDLLRHVLNVWKDEAKEEYQMTAMPEEENSSGSEYHHEPVTLTQDSDTMTPLRNGSDTDADVSPIPTQFFRFCEDGPAKENLDFR